MSRFAQAAEECGCPFKKPAALRGEINRLARDMPAVLRCPRCAKGFERGGPMKRLRMLRRHLEMDHIAPGRWWLKPSRPRSGCICGFYLGLGGVDGLFGLWHLMTLISRGELDAHFVIEALAKAGGEEEKTVWDSDTAATWG